MKVNEIIIDDVDVKDCTRRIGKNNYCRYFKRPCEKIIITVFGNKKCA